MTQYRSFFLPSVTALPERPVECVRGMKLGESHTRALSAYTQGLDTRGSADFLQFGASPQCTQGGRIKLQ